jgi:hypothetical protein
MDEEEQKKIRSVSWWWNAPGYFDKWRVFPRIFISMYIFMLYETGTWFMLLADPTNAQAGFVSVIVGAGAAWFGLYVNSGHTQPPSVISPMQAARLRAYDEAKSPSSERPIVSVSATYSPRIIRRDRRDELFDDDAPKG